MTLLYKIKLLIVVVYSINQLLNCAYILSKLFTPNFLKIKLL